MTLLMKSTPAEHHQCCEIQTTLAVALPEPVRIHRQGLQCRGTGCRVLLHAACKVLPTTPLPVRYGHLDGTSNGFTCSLRAFWVHGNAAEKRGSVTATCVLCERGVK